ncbi:hypothetical protein [Sphaerothrix gracilis]|uniref:hypothetical protein n=1 Tax=Sphaerothrix gracilis TaxID=3151835 RepID=UPI0031FC1583
MLTLPDPKVNLPISVQERKLTAERMHDVHLILENLFMREEATVKLVLDCLYDVGSVNLINERFTNRPLNRVMKMIAKMTKPAFRFFAVRWFQKNCPRLISDWLYTQVIFSGDFLEASPIPTPDAEG